MSGKYMLNERGEPVLVKDLLTWARWMEKGEQRIVKQEAIGPYMVSTVFLGLDHNFFDEGSPILWETMVFLNEEQLEKLGAEQACNRCAGGREQALAMHADMLERVEAIHALTYELKEKIDTLPRAHKKKK